MLVRLVRLVGTLHGLRAAQMLNRLFIQLRKISIRHPRRSIRRVGAFLTAAAASP